LYQTLLADSSFFELLLRCDEDLAAEARERGCACGGALHSARYRRKPRGGPAGLGAEHAMRLSFCCAVAGCRRRATPPSLRFLGRKVFFSVVVVLVPILSEGLTRRRVERLAAVFAVSQRTLRRWRQWWREHFARSRFFAARRGDFARPVAPAGLPGSLVAAFAPGGSGPGEQVAAVLRWLAPWGAGETAAGWGVCGSAATRRGCSLDPSRWRT
jgi:hypothetical protein